MLTVVPLAPKGFMATTSSPLSLAGAKQMVEPAALFLKKPNCQKGQTFS